MAQARPASASRTEPLPLLEWIPQVSEEHESPTHLADVTDAFERIAKREAVRMALSVPPRHWKTTTILHGVTWLFERIPGLRVAYLTHSDAQAERKSRDARRIAKRTIGIGDRDTFSEWSTTNGGVFRAASITSGVTGEGFDVIIVDDPYRRRQDAESATIRGRVQESFEADIITRQGNTPTSFLVVHTRWHVDDLIGHITDPEFMGGYPFHLVNLPAINDNGEALCPKHWPVERLLPHQANAYEWWSQWQGQPRPRGGEVFAAATYYDPEDRPGVGRWGIGVDLAYTAKTKADWSVSLLGMIVFSGQDAEGDPIPWIYIVDRVKRQVRAPEFLRELEDHSEQAPGAPMRWYAAGSERGAADFIISEGVALDVVNATSDKFIRAQPVSATWNAGRILVPRNASWAADFVRVVKNFTGVNDDEDDDVDALAALHDALVDTPSLDVRTSGHERVSSGLRGRGVGSRLRGR